MNLGGCGECVCLGCLGYRTGKCPNGGCFDEWRAAHDPWKGPVRTSWTDWGKPGEQAHWCRGGAFYPAEACEDYTRYDPAEHRVMTCFGANVQKFQDGTILCSLVDSMGCERCIEYFGDGVLEGEGE